MKKAIKKSSTYLMIGMMSMALLGACSDDDDDAPATTGGAAASSSGTTGGGTTTPASEQTKAYGTYDGRSNGDRPTWRWDSPLVRMKDLPSEFTLDIPGCYDNVKVINNGSRYETNGIIIKQSDGHPGMAVIAPSSCHSTQSAYVSYTK